jgi:hypothetical protein
VKAVEEKFDAEESPFVPKCWGRIGSLEKQGWSEEHLKRIVDSCEKKIGPAKWEDHYAFPINCFSGRTQRIAQGQSPEQVKPFRTIGSHEEDHYNRAGVKRHIIIPEHPHPYVSLEPYTSFTADPFPTDGSNLERFEWYRREHGAGKAIKKMHSPDGLYKTVTDEFDYDGEYVVRCVNCCQPVTTHGTARFVREASRAEWMCLEALAAGGELDRFDLRISLARSRKIHYSPCDRDRVDFVARPRHNLMG